MDFQVKKTKTCRNHLKKWYDLPIPTNARLLEYFDFLGEPEMTDMRQFMPESLILFRFRSYEFQIELSGGINGKEVFVILPKMNPEAENLIEETLSEWLAD